MKCYLCGSDSFNSRKGEVRDNKLLGIYECKVCCLVSLSSIDHIEPDFYEKSGMHGECLVPMHTWLSETEWDDNRRFEMLKPRLPNNRVLDFGCGAGGFLAKAKHLASDVAGIELEERVREHWSGRMQIYPSMEKLKGEWNLITAFHVLEHLKDPILVLKELATRLAKNGQMVLEVPSANDALLGLYDCEEFQKFTYWSQHLYLFNPDNLRRLAELAGLKVISIQQVQRYPLSNHLYWLSRGVPGGHKRWAFLDKAELSAAYEAALASIGQCDTLIANLERSS